MEEDKHSPDDEYEEVESGESLKNLIHMLFKHYTSFGDRTNMAYIQGNKVQKMMKECNVIGKKVTKTDIDMIFSKVNKSKPNMYFEDFLELLNQVATLKFKSSPADAFKELFYQHIYPRCEALGLATKEKPADVEFDSITEELFINKVNLLYDIYHSYFTFRIDKVDKTTTKEVQRCEKYLFEFLRDFEICPKLMSKSKVYTLWHHIIEKSKGKNKPVYTNASKQLSKSYDIKEENKLFTFAFFLDFVVLVANTQYMKKRSDVFKSVSSPEAVIMLFERMEISEGFHNFEAKMHRTHSDSSSLIPPDEIKEKLAKRKPTKPEIVEDKEQKSQLNDFLNSKAAPSKSSGTKGKGSRKGSTNSTTATKKKAAPKKTDATKTTMVKKDKLDSGLDIAQYSDDVQQYIPQLKVIFSYYCSFGEPDNHTKLKSSMFQKMLKDAKIIK